jgi:imidazolonepropionase-like amidohydrolase
VLANEDSMLQRGPPSADPRWRFLRKDEHLRWQGFIAGYTAQDAELATQRWPVARRIVSIMHEAGVPIMTGTDSPMPGVYPGYSLHDEMAMLVESGLTAREALRSATLAPAQFLGIAAVSGLVATGKRADLVLLDANPLVDIANTRRIAAVVFNGRYLPRTELDREMAVLAARNAGH